MVRNTIVASATMLCIAVGIVVITPLVSSPESANCSAEQATDAGITNFAPGDTPDHVINAPFYDQAGTILSLANYSGKSLLVNFWATWCAPCVAEMPALDRLQAILEGTDIEVLVINEDRNGAEVAPGFFVENNLQHLDILLDRDQKLIRAAGVTGLPTTLLIDKKGKVLSAVLGDTEWDAPDIVSFVRRCFEYGES